MALTGLWAPLGIGIAFGFALERAGLGSARKVTGQFYLTDLTVFKVMFTAIVTAMLGTFALDRAGVIDLATLYVPDTFLPAQVTGGLVFGAGFAFAGLCPGTSCVSAATGRVDGMAVVAGMFGGVLLTGLAFPLLEGLYDAGARGPLTLPQVLGAPYGAVVFAVVVLAVAGFAAAERIEGRPPSRRLAWAAVAVLVLGAAAAVVRPPASREQPGVTSAPQPAPRVRPASGC
jgi:uncharacterized membrane protein YedE/YeeE